MSLSCFNSMTDMSSGPDAFFVLRFDMMLETSAAVVSSRNIELGCLYLREFCKYSKSTVDSKCLPRTEKCSFRVLIMLYLSVIF